MTNQQEAARSLWDSLTDAQRDDLRAGKVDAEMAARITHALGLGPVVTWWPGAEGRELTVLPPALRRIVEDDAD